MAYSEKLKDPRWQKKRLEILERDNWQCQSTGLRNEPLIVHHLRYFPNLDPWEYDEKYLLTISEDEHKRLHGKNRIPTIKDIIIMSEFEYRDDIIWRMTQLESWEVLQVIKAGRFH